MSQHDDQNNNMLDTQRMMNKLKSDSFDGFSADEFIDDSIEVFFTTLFNQTGLQKSDIILKANIDRNYGYQIFNGIRIAERDYYLRIALAMKLDLRTTQRLLAVVGRSALHPLIKRDAAIIFAINNGYDNDRIYDFLCELGLPPLEKEI